MGNVDSLRGIVAKILERKTRATSKKEKKKKGGSLEGFSDSKDKIM